MTKKRETAKTLMRRHLKELELNRAMMLEIVVCLEAINSTLKKLVKET